MNSNENPQSDLKDANQINKTNSQEMMHQLAFGLFCLYDGTKILFMHKQSRKRLFQIFIFLLAYHILSLLVINFLTNWSFLLKSIIGIFAGEKAATNLTKTLFKVIYTFTHTLLSVPEFILLIVRQIYPAPLDALFIQVFKDTSKQKFKIQPNEIKVLSILLQSNRKQWYLRIYTFIQKYGKRFFYFTLLYVLSFIPIIGECVYPLSVLKFTYTTLGQSTAILLSILSFIPKLHPYLKITVFGYIGYLICTREILDVYSSRSKMLNKSGWFKSREWVLAGFCLPVYFLSRISGLGPLFFCIGLSASARIVIEVYDDIDCVE